jgi:hypothetical protein
MRVTDKHGLGSFSDASPTLLCVGMTTRGWSGTSLSNTINQLVKLPPDALPTAPPYSARYLL